MMMHPLVFHSCAERRPVKLISTVEIAGWNLMVIVKVGADDVIFGQCSGIVSKKSTPLLNFDLNNPL